MKRNRRDYMLRRYQKRRALGIARLGGKCVACPSVDDIQFDHIDPTTKTFDLLSRCNLSLARWLTELAKCQLLCGECHRKKHGKGSVQIGVTVFQCPKGHPYTRDNTYTHRPTGKRSCITCRREGVRKIRSHAA